MPSFNHHYDSVHTIPVSLDEFDELGTPEADLTFCFHPAHVDSPDDGAYIELQTLLDTENEKELEFDLDEHLCSHLKDCAWGYIEYLRTCDDE